MKKIFALIGIAAVVAISFAASAQTVVTEMNASGGTTTITNPVPSAPNLFKDIGAVLKDIGFSSNPTNYAVAPFFGVSTSKNNQGKHALSSGLMVIENMTESGSLGLAVGIDHLWYGGHANAANIVSGGLSLKAAFYPARVGCSFLGIGIGTNTWAYSFKATPYALTLIGTPINGTDNNGGLCAINRVGINFDVYNLKGWIFGAGGDYGNRVGAGNYSGNWIDFTLNVRKGF